MPYQGAVYSIILYKSVFFNNTHHFIDKIMTNLYVYVKTDFSPTNYMCSQLFSLFILIRYKSYFSIINLNVFLYMFIDYRNFSF